MESKTDGFETCWILIVSAIVLSMTLVTACAQPKSAPLTSQAQNTTLAGEPIAWEDQGVSFTLPAGWRTVKKGSDQFVATDPEGARLSIIVVDSLSDSSPEKALSEEYERKLQQQKPDPVYKFRYEDVRYLVLDGVNGLVSRLVDERDVDLGWQAFRKRNGKQQGISIRITIPVDSFDRRRDEIYNILYSTKLIQSK